LSLLGTASLAVLAGCADLDSSGQSASSVSQERQAADERLAKWREEEAQRITEICSRIAKELPGYSRDYVKRVVEILGTCQKALESPRFLIGTVHAEAATRFDTLLLDFPEQRSSGARHGLDLLVHSLGMLSALDADSFSGSAGRNIGYRMSNDISAMRAALIK
jgi:hypothetical protein